MHVDSKIRQITTLAVLAATLPMHAVWAADGELRLEIVDSQSRQPLPVRATLANSRGRTMRTRGIGVGQLGDHFYVPGAATLGLRRGAYLFTLDAGAEYRTQRGDFEIERYADDEKVVEMRRFANLGDEGWFAGDLDATRPARDLPIMAAAEGLHYVPTIAWHFDGRQWNPSHATVRQPVDTAADYAAGRALGPTAAYVELAGGTLLLVGKQAMSEPPFDLTPETTSLEVIHAAHDLHLRVVAATPTSWDLPLWVADGRLDAMCLLSRQSEAETVVEKDPHGRPRDRSFFPGKQGLPRWGQAIYFHLLNSGVRLPIVAGSGSGANESPLGTNRTYVHQYNSFNLDAWWQGVVDGATVVTNGPLVRPSVRGEPPGAVFRLAAGEKIDFQVAMNLASRTPVEYLEILKNGKVEAEVRLADWASQGGRLPPVSFDAGGWFAIRAATGETNRYQFALTAPYYVESPAGPMVSRAAAEFFLAWLDELEGRIGDNASCTTTQLETARAFWQSKLKIATAP